MTEWSWEPLDLDEAVRLLEGFPVRWWVAGGWALDLYLGRTIREHDDLDVLVLRDDQLAVQRHLPGWDIQVAHRGRLEPWREGQPIEPPRSGLWARTRWEGPWEIQFLLAEHAGDVWRYHRDAALTLPVAEIGLLSKQGVPYLRPELVLLHKSHHLRERDETDLEAVLPELGPAARARLKGWLAPGHAWLSRI